MLKHEHIRITTAGQEAFRATALRPKFGTFWLRTLAVLKVKPRSTICLAPSSIGPINYRRTLCFKKNQLIRLWTVKEEAFGVTLPRTSQFAYRLVCSYFPWHASILAKFADMTVKNAGPIGTYPENLITSGPQLFDLSCEQTDGRMNKATWQSCDFAVGDNNNADCTLCSMWTSVWRSPMTAVRVAVVNRIPSSCLLTCPRSTSPQCSTSIVSTCESLVTDVVCIAPPHAQLWYCVRRISVVSK